MAEASALDVRLSFHPDQFVVINENDDRLFRPADLLPLCERARIPFIYDAHHHRCNADRMSESEATERCVTTWGNREPWAHLSSPRDGWSSPNPRPHHDYIATGDVPDAWRGLRMTVDIEAKAKELAVVALARALSHG